MFNIFKKLKQIMMKKDEIDQQLKDAISVAQKLGAENKILKTENDILKTDNAKLKDEFNSAVERVRYLADQLKMKEARQEAQEKFNDNDRNY
jgi:methyl coenzyme M reductase gamma subunit